MKRGRKKQVHTDGSVETTYTVAEVMQICRASERTVKRWLKQGYYGVVLRSLKYGGNRVITASALDEFAERCEEVGPETERIEFDPAARRRAARELKKAKQEGLLV